MSKDRLFRREKGVETRPPRPPVITNRDMESAYVLENRRARRRIEDYGRVNRNSLRELGAVIRRSK